MHTRSLPAQSPRSHHGEGWRSGPNAAAARRSVTSGATTSSRTTLAIIAALCLCGGVGLTEAKVLRGTIKLTGEAPEGYISKFSINEEGFIEGTLITVNGQPFHTGYVRSLGFSPPVHRRSPRPATGTHCTTLIAGHVCATPSMVPVLPPQCIPVPLLVSLACPSGARCLGIQRVERVVRPYPSLLACQQSSDRGGSIEISHTSACHLQEHRAISL